MSINPSPFGRKQQQRASGGGTGMEPPDVDVGLEPFMDAFSLTPFSVLPASAPLAVDWKETPTAHVFMTDVPGVRKGEVKIEVEEEKILKISGQRSRQAEEKADKWHRIERGSEKFVRTVRLPPNVNADNVHAVLENGVLTVTVPKNHEKKSYGKLIPITN